MLDDLDQWFQTVPGELAELFWGLTGGREGAEYMPPHPCPLQPLQKHLPFLYWLWHKISSINIWKTTGLDCRGNKPVTSWPTQFLKTQRECLGQGIHIWLCAGGHHP